MKYEELANLSESERKGIYRLKRKIILQYVNLEKFSATQNTVAKNMLNLKPNHKDVIKSLEGKNLLVMCGGGKDSLMVLSGARAIQMMILKEYGSTFILRVGIGRQPGMIDVGDNLQNAFDALALNDDKLVDIFYIDGKMTQNYQKDLLIPKHVTELHKNSVLLNAHIFSGAGRRSFCDDCNKSLGGWIATALAYKNGADLFMTGDSQKELRTQIGSNIPEIAQALNVNLPKNTKKQTPSQYAFALLDIVGNTHSKYVYGDTIAINLRSIDYQNIPNRTRFISFFSSVGYESRDRLDFLTNFLKFNFDSLMFSFTESDCGNPALMCHLYGLIAQHCHNSSYNDGIRMYVNYAISKMQEKGFPDILIQKMRQRYQNDDNILVMREKIEDYAKRAYGFTSENLVAMVYAPFTQNCYNLKPYLNYLQNSNKIFQNSFKNAEFEIHKALSANQDLTAIQQEIIEHLQNLTGLNIKQMRHLFSLGLALNNFNVKHQANSSNIRKLKTAMDMDSLYIGEGVLKTKDQNICITIRGR